VANPFHFIGVPIKQEGQAEAGSVLTPVEVLFSATPAGDVCGWRQVASKLCIITT
jgi:hypothetical protein